MFIKKGLKRLVPSSGETASYGTVSMNDADEAISLLSLFIC